MVPQELLHWDEDRLELEIRDPVRRIVLDGQETDRLPIEAGRHAVAVTCG
jgi:hypothetical protein